MDYDDLLDYTLVTYIHTRFGVLRIYMNGNKYIIKIGGEFYPEPIEGLGSLLEKLDSLGYITIND